jgi:hypothetical protein
MWELNQSGMSDREMLETVKQEGNKTIAMLVQPINLL